MAHHITITTCSSIVLRQMITAATEMFSRTHFIPSRTYHCTYFYNSSKRPFTHLILDGQTVAIFKRNMHPFVINTSNCPTLPVPIPAACAEKLATVRRVTRKRAKDRWDEATSFTASHLHCLVCLMRAAGDALPVDLLQANRAAAAEWAGSAVHLVAESTTSPVLVHSELARLLLNASVEHFSRAKFCSRAVYTYFMYASEASLEEPPILYRALAGMPVCKRMQILNKRVRARLFSKRGFSSISARCVRTPLSRRVYYVEHGCRGPAQVPGFHT